MKDKYIKALVDATKYRRDKVGKKVLSASSIMEEDLISYLNFFYEPVERNFDQSTIGSLFQLGVDKALDNSGFKSAIRMEVELIDDWLLSGEIDQVIEDDNTVWIVDNKLTKFSSYEKIKKDRLHPYNIQLKVYEYMYKRIYNTNKQIRTMLVLFFKNGTEFGKKIPNYLIIEDAGLNIRDEELESIMFDKVKRMEHFIEKKELPQECSEKFWDRSYNPAKPMRCIKFCSQNKNCPYYKKFDYGHKRKALKRLLNSL